MPMSARLATRTHGSSWPDQRRGWSSLGLATRPTSVPLTAPNELRGACGALIEQHVRTLHVVWSPGLRANFRGLWKLGGRYCRGFYRSWAMDTVHLVTRGLTPRSRGGLGVPDPSLRADGADVRRRSTLGVAATQLRERIWTTSAGVVRRNGSVYATSRPSRLMGQSRRSPSRPLFRCLRSPSLLPPPGPARESRCQGPLRALLGPRLDPQRLMPGALPHARVVAADTCPLFGRGDGERRPHQRPADPARAFDGGAGHVGAHDRAPIAHDNEHRPYSRRGQGRLGAA